MHKPEQQLESQTPDTSGSSIPHWAEATNGLAKKELDQRVKKSVQAQKSIRKEQKNQFILLLN